MCRFREHVVTALTADARNDPTCGRFLAIRSRYAEKSRYTGAATTTNRGSVRFGPVDVCSVSRSAGLGWIQLVSSGDTRGWTSVTTYLSAVPAGGLPKPSPPTRAFPRG